jgi:hypothetical protein
MAEPKRPQWYVQFREGEEGPMTSQNLRDLAEAGKIHPDTPIRKEGMAKAIPASKVRGLLQHPPQTYITESQRRADTEHSIFQLPKENAEMNSLGGKDMETSERSNSSESFFSIAEGATLREDFQTALKNYSLFIETELINKDILQIAHINRGLILIHLDSVEKGKKDLLRAIELGSDKAREIYEQLIYEPNSTTIVDQDVSVNKYSTQSIDINFPEPINDISIKAGSTSLWILILGGIVNITLYVFSPFGKGLGIYILAIKLAIVIALTGASYGIVCFFSWLTKLLIKERLPPIHRAVMCSVLCTLIILGAILHYNIHGK